jgi:hypothetical protein
MAKLIMVDGTIKEVAPRKGESFELDEMQAFVGGLIEPVYLEDGTTMLVNEEGLLMGLPMNALASALVGFPLVGPALICDGKEFQ